MAITLSALLAHQPFELELVTRSPLRDGAVRGVSPLEGSDPGRWVAPDYVVVTNGAALRGNPELQRRFIREAHDAGARAVGLWRDSAFKVVPDAMLEEAEQLGFAVFMIPYELPARELILFVMRAVVNAEARELSRAESAHESLLGVLNGPDPINDLVDRLHAVLRAPVAVFAPTQEVLARAGFPPLEAMWAAVSSGAEMTPLGHHWLFSATALVDDVPFAHLAVRLHQKPRPGTYAGSVVRFAIRILQMIGIAGRARVEQEGALRVAVLRDLLEVAVPDRALLERLRVLGFQPDACVRIVLADRAAEIPARSAANELAGAFARHGTRAIVDPGEHEALVLVERDSDERATLAALAAGAQRQLVNAGVGLAVTLREGVQQTQREAMVARLRARREGAEVVWFDDVGLADQLLSWPQAYRLSSAGELLAPLVERPDLLHTLTVYLEHDCSVPATASALFLHTNSIRYRLSTIERLLGRSLSSIDTVLDLTLAMRIKAVAHEGSQSAQAPGAR